MNPSVARLRNLQRWVRKCLPATKSRRSHGGKSSRPEYVLLEALEPRTMLTELLNVAAFDANASESGPDSGTFRISRTGPTTTSVTVSYLYSGTATVRSDYFSSPSGSAIISAGSSYVDVTISPVDDTTSEGDETVIMTISPSGPYMVGTGEATVTIADNEPPQVSISATDNSANEGGHTGTFTVTRSFASSTALTVSFTVGGSATAVDDYSSLGTSVTIPANQTSATLTVTANTDSVTDPNESVIVTVTTTGSAYTLGTNSEATVTIVEVPIVSIAATDPNASEPGSNGGVFTVTRTQVKNTPLTVQFAVAGTATTDADYATFGSTVVIPANQASATISVTPIDDQIFESSETVIVTLNASGSSYDVAASPANSATVSIADNEVLLPPVFDSPPTPASNSTVTRTVCQNEVAYIDILGHDQDSSGSTTLTYTVTGPSGFTIGTNPANDSPAVVVPTSIGTGTYSLTVKGTDNEGAFVQRSFSLNFIRRPIPGATSISLQTANVGRVVELSAGATSGSVSLAWTPSSDADAYDYVLYRFDGGAANGGWSAYSSLQSGNVLATSYSALPVGYYAIFVRGTNCSSMQLGPWAGLTFAIAKAGDLEPKDAGQHNNFEDVCECDVLPPGEDIEELHVTSDTGDLIGAIGRLVNAGAEALSNYLTPTYVSGGDSQLSIEATIPIPAAATDVRVDVEVRNSTGTLVGIKTYSPGENTLQINKDGIVAFRVDPAALNSPGGGAAAPLVTGNYTVSATIRADLPGFSSALPMTMNFRTATVSAQLVNSADRSFAPGFSATGVNRLRVDAGGVSLNRSIGTSVRFDKVGANYVTPAGSFTSVADVSMSVPSPLGGSNTAVFKLTSQSGMISLFDANGLLLERCEPNGDIIRFGYQDVKGDGTADDVVRILSVPTNHQIDYGYVAGKIATVTDWVGRIWSYAYTGAQLTGITGPAPEPGKPAPKIVLGWIPGTNRLSSYTVTDTASSFAQTTSINWDAWGNVSQIQRLDTQGDSGGARTWQFESAETRQLNQVRIVDTVGAIGPEDHFASVTFPDGSGSLVQMDPFGNSLREQRTVFGYLSGTTLTTVYQRNANGQATTVGPFTQIAGGITSTVTGISYGYDSLGRKTSATYPDGTTEVWTYGVGASAQQPATFKDRVNHYFVYSSYSDSNPGRIDYYSSQGGTLVSTTRYTWQNGRIRTVATADPNGLGGSGTGFEYFYDSHLNLTNVRTTTASATGVLAAPSINDIWVSFGYDSLENPLWMTSEYRPASVAGSPAVPPSGDVNLMSVRTDFTSDVYGRILTALTPVPSTGMGRLLTTSTFDAIGRTLTFVEPGSTAAIARTTSQGWNSFGELETVTMPDPDDAPGPLSALSYAFTYDSNGNLFETARKNGSSTVSRVRMGYDSVGRLRLESMALPGLAAPLNTNEATYYQYDPVGRVTRVDSPIGTAGLNQAKYLVTSRSYNDSSQTVTTSWSSSGSGVIAPNVANLVEIFDAVGRPVSSSQGGLTKSWQYFDNSTWSGVGTLVKTTDERGQVWWEKQGPTGLTTRTQTPDPDGTNTALSLINVQNVFDVRGNLQSSTESSGTLSRTTTYSYTPIDLLQSITSPAPNSNQPGLVTSYTYDKLQRVATQTGPSGVTMISTYRDDGLLGTVTRDDQNLLTADWFATYAYDNLNRVTAITNPDGTSSTAYDALGNVSLVSTPDPDGAAGPLGPMTMTSLYATGTAGQFLSETLDTNGSQTKFTTDSAGRVIAQFRPNHTNNISQQLTDGSASTTATETWTYDALGRVQSAVDALGNTVIYVYDSLSRLASVGNGIRTQQYAFATNGDLASETDPLGRVTQYTGYDNLGRLTQSQRMLGSSVSDVSRITWDSLGRVQSTTALAGVAGKEMITSREYDLLDRPTRVTDALGGQTNYSYDNRGFLAQSDDPLGHSTYFYTDNAGRLSALWTEGFSQATGTRYTYDAMDRVKTMTDPLNNVTAWDYDATGRVVKRTDPAQAGGSPVTQFAYDADGNLKSVTDPLNNVTTYEYDARNRLRRDTITLGGQAATREYWYDNADNLFWSKDRNGRWTRYSFDFAFGAGSGSNYRLLEEAWWVSGSIYSNKITNSYNAGNGLLMTEITDQRNLNASTPSTDFTSRVSFTYDGLARVSTATDWLQPQSKSDAFELKYLYADGVDRRTGTEARFAQFNTSGVQTANFWDFRNSYTWDKLNRVDDMKQESASNPTAATWSAAASTTRFVDLNYRADSSLQTISRTQATTGTTPIVTTVSQTTDGQKNEGRLASITHSGLNGLNTSYSYTYDDQGRVATFTTLAGTRTYSYDSFDQLTGATGGSQAAETYSYDTNGNRTGAGVTTSAYNRVTNDGTYTYQYDNEGNRTRRTKISTGDYELYAWDYRQRLTSVTQKNSAGATQKTTTYEYDGLDRRIRRSVSNAAGTVTEKQRFLFDSNVTDGSTAEVVLVLDELASGLPYQEVDHRFMNGPAIDQVFANEGSGSGNQVLWYLSDSQNTVRDVAQYSATTAGSTAKIRNHLEYDAFGNVTSVDDPTTTGNPSDGDLPGLEGTGNEYSPQRSYTGREPDSATGLIYYRARWYDPTLGRFISEDPIGFSAGDANLSRYVGNSTTNLIDPSGLDDVGMHWIVQEVINAIPSNQITEEARKYLLKETTPTGGAFNHANDTFWDKVTGERYTHPQYNKYNKEFVDLFIKANGKIDLNKAIQLRCMFDSPEQIIAAGKALGVTDEAAQYLARYQTGYYRTMALAESLSQDFSKLSALERKRLARLLAAGDKSQYAGEALKELERLEKVVRSSSESAKALDAIRGMSTASRVSFLKKGWHKLGPVLKLGGKLLGVAGVCFTANTAYAGSQGRGHHPELTGAIGAVDNMAYDAVFGEYVEDLARAVGDQTASVILPVTPSHIRNETRHGLEPLPSDITGGVSTPISVKPKATTPIVVPANESWSDWFFRMLGST